MHPRGRGCHRGIHVAGEAKQPSPSTITITITITTTTRYTIAANDNDASMTMTNSSSSAIRSFRRRLHSSFRSIFLLSLCIILILPVQSQNNYCSHDGGLWGSLKSSIVPLAQPVQDSLCREYNKLSDTGRFVAGACVGFGASKLVVGGKKMYFVVYSLYIILSPVASSNYGATTNCQLHEV